MGILRPLETRSLFVVEDASLPVVPFTGKGRVYYNENYLLDVIYEKRSRLGKILP